MANDNTKIGEFVSGLPSNTAKNQKVVEGKTSVRKKSLAEKFSDAFIVEDANSVKSYVWTDIIVPSLKDISYNIINGAVEMMLYGSTNRRPANIARGVVNQVSYNLMGQGAKPVQARPQDPKSYYGFQDILFDTRDDAIRVLDGLLESIDRYGKVSVGDLNDLIGTTGEFTDYNYGWYMLGQARVKPVRGGYVLDLPKPQLLTRG